MFSVISHWENENQTIMIYHNTFSRTAKLKKKTTDFYQVLIKCQVFVNTKFIDRYCVTILTWLYKELLSETILYTLYWALFLKRQMFRIIKLSHFQNKHYL